MNKYLTVISVSVLVIAISVQIISYNVYGATTPTLSTIQDYAILSSTYTNTSVTTVSGSVGFTTPPAVAPLGVHSNFGSGAPYATVGIEQGSILSTLNAQPCDFIFGSATDLSLLTQPLTPGVYCVTGATSVGTGGISLTTGTYIFRIDGALNTVANSQVTGGNACDIFWTPTGATTLGANSIFRGTDIDDAGITVGANVTWSGRALAFGGTVTTDTDTISAPSCAIPVPPVTPPNNDTGGTYACPLFPYTPANPCPVATTTPVATSTPIISTTTPSLPNAGLPPNNWKD